MSGMAHTVPLADSGTTRAEYGCIVTFENEHGKTFSVHRKGPPTAGVRDACRIALALDSSFRVVSYSTPQTIFTDMQGAREAGVRPGYALRGHRQTFPEASVLGRVKLGHLLHPRLVG